MNAKLPIRPIRSALLAAIPILLACAALFALYRLQVVTTEEELQEGLNTVVSSERVPAARGSLLDRNGVALVTNRVGYRVLINREQFVTSADPNGSLLALIALADAAGFSHTDTLPVTAGSPPRYTLMNRTQSDRLSRYWAYFELGEPSAEELMLWFREHYAIPETYTAAEARLAAGVRWELELRTLFGIADYVFLTDPSAQLLSAIAERCDPGVSIVTDADRRIETQLAAHVLGRVGPMDADEVETYTALGYPMDALVGKDGAEAAFERYLHGTDGLRTTVRSASGEILSIAFAEEPIVGSDVRLTLDIRCQQVAEEALAAKIEQINADRLAGASNPESVTLADGGAVVVLQVGTSDILALASYPTFDLTRFSENYSELIADASAPLYNRAIQGTYAPGSTFKPVTATAGLAEGAITPSTRIYDRGIIDEYQGYTYTCWAYPGSHGSINVREALQMSCNYFFYITGRETGIDAIDRYAEAYGLGQETGIELPENTGTLASRSFKESVIGESWYVGDTFQASIGQSYHAFTPLQLASYAATIATGGIRYAAHLFLQTEGPEPVVYEPEILDTVDAPEEVFTELKEGMYMASRYGSASYVFGNYPIAVCSKTGTAQISEDSVNNAVFIAFAPMEEPEIALAVVVENGANGYYLAEVAKEIFDWYFGLD